MLQRNDLLALVTEFCIAMEQPVSQGFDDDAGLRLGGSLVMEESLELHEALSLYLVGPKTHEARAHIVKELSDVLYVAGWLAARIGIDITESVRRVHLSNMSKLGDDGKPCKDENGKVRKGPHYLPPDLDDIVSAVPVTL